MQQQERTQVRLDEMRGAPVYDTDGGKIGKIDEIFYDDQTRVPEWVGIGSGGIFGKKRVVVPVAGARVVDDGIAVPFSKDQVKDSPEIGDEHHLSQEFESELTAYYGLEYSEQRSDTGLPAGARRGATEDAVTRSEEELQVRKRDVEAGRARLRKWVETEPVALDVELRREVARVSREPIDEPARDHDFEEQEVEVPLHAEQPVVQKQAVAKERVGIEKGVESRTEKVQDEVRKERVEVEGDGVEER